MAKIRKCVICGGNYEADRKKKTCSVDCGNTLDVLTARKYIKKYMKRYRKCLVLSDK